MAFHSATEAEAKGEFDGHSEIEILAAELSTVPETAPKTGDRVSPDTENAIDQQLQQINAEIERCAVHAEKGLYAYAVACGIVSGWMDSLFFSETRILQNDLAFSHRQVNQFIQDYANSRGLGRDHLKDAIGELEKAFPVAQDNIWKGKIPGVTPRNHHLADLAHHPTPAGLAAALMVQFLRIGTFVNKDGEWHFSFVKTTAQDIVCVAVPAVVTGILNWLVAVSEKNYEAETGEEMPKAVQRLFHLAASTPIIFEIAKCADNWFGHLVSDMGGSKNTAGSGMGIPGVFLSLMYEISALPLLKDTGLTAVLNDLYTNHKVDLRHELALGESVKTQAIPVLFNEIAVRVGCMLFHLAHEVQKNNGVHGINWRYVIPFANRTVDRMIAVAAMTFNIADTGDAAFRAAIESGGNWVLFSCRFAARYNYVGAGRAAIAVVKEFSNEKREAQLIHERMILMEAKSQMMYQRLQEFKARLDERITAYFTEDIQAFMEGFHSIDEGLKTNDSDLVIRGNVTIQRVLGRDVQFASQKEFDALMDSDIPLQL